MDLHDVVTVYTLSDPSRAEVIRAALQGEGIPCQLGGERQGCFPGVVEIEVLVRACDVDAAERIIASHE